MKNIKKLVHDIHEGKNLRINLEIYRDMAVGSYHDYAFLQLVFSAYTLMEELNEEKPEIAKKEEKIVSEIHCALAKVATAKSFEDEVLQKMMEVRKEITEKMDLFTAITDCLICYEYVLNRMEWKYATDKQKNEMISSYSKDTMMQQIMLYLVDSDEKSINMDKLHAIVGQLPIHMTKTKFYERLGQTFTLYKDGEQSSVDEFVYMLKTSGMIYHWNHYKDEYKDYTKFVEQLNQCDFLTMDEKTYGELTDQMESAAMQIHEITDFYYSLQEVVNSICSVCLCHKHDGGSSNIVEEAKKVIEKIEQGILDEEMLVPLEGKIERYVEESSYLEAILFEIQDCFHEELENLSYVELFEDLSKVANLLSGSLFVDMVSQNEQQKATDSYIQSVLEEMTKEFDQKFEQVSKPVKRAMMSMVIEKLPVMFQDVNEMQEYIAHNLFDCTDKAEKAASLEIISDLIREQ